jgi:alkylated DNA nucleotide flippase Atl1
VTGYAEAVWDLVRSVPPGRVTTYGDIAEAYYGVRKGARGIGQAIAHCPDDVPWWRVVGAGGVIIERPHAREQRARLLEEGVVFGPGAGGGADGACGRVDLRRSGGVFSPPSRRPVT